jgi:uncharacterized protein YkwD
MSTWRGRPWSIVGRIGVGIVAALSAVCATTAFGSERAVEDLESRVARRVNAIRGEHMRPPLRTDPELTRIAREYSCALLERGALSHQDPGGKTVGDRVLAAGKQYQAVGENLASSSGAGDPVDAAISAWMRSTGHRENILRPDFVETGVGGCGQGETYYFTQIFLRPAPSRR